MQLKSWLTLGVASAALGLMVGLFAAGRLAAKHSERYAEEVMSYSRYIQAKERANLVRLLENNEVQRAEELLYIVLRDNFKDLSDRPDSEKRARACELLKVLRPGFVASAQGTGEQLESRRALVETIRSATASCDAGAK